MIEQYPGDDHPWPLDQEKLRKILAAAGAALEEAECEHFRRYGISIWNDDEVWAENDDPDDYDDYDC